MRRIRWLRSLWRFSSGWRADGRPGRWRRALVRNGSVLGLVAVLTAWFAFPVTPWVLAGILAAAAGGAVWRWVIGFRHRRTWLRPLHLAACDLAGIDRRRAPREWLEVNRARTRAVLSLPAGFSAEQKDKDRLVTIASAKLGMEGAEPRWHLAGPKPHLMLLPSPAPPPQRVILADVRAAIDRAGPDEVIWGLGKRSALVDTSWALDSPHYGLSMGSGAGKSATARALLAQMLYKGCIGLILDYKMISHQWAAGLPNVAIARRPHEIHAALLWLGREVERRNEVALAGADMDGNVHAVVGPRLIVICEELNATVARLRAYWREIRDRDDQVRSPALEALDSVSFMGRQVLCNVIYIGQRLSVKASGGDGDARENIGVIAFGRYSPSNWKMLAADHAMPPSSRKAGRIQVVSDEVRETQGVFMPAREARGLATAGEVALCPAGMPGALRVPGTAELVSVGAPEQGPSYGTGTEPPALPGLVTLREWSDSGMSALSVDALRKAAQRPGFPPRAGWRGKAGEWDAVELAEWEATR